jgi:hypothetical protein
MLAGLLLGSGYVARENVSMPTIPNGPMGIINDSIKYPCVSKFSIYALIRFLPIEYWISGTHCHPNYVVFCGWRVLFHIKLKMFQPFKGCLF